MLRPVVIATAVAGTLDILAALFFAGQAGIEPMQVLHFVASGPLDGPTAAGIAFAAAGLAVHFAIMACMVAAYMLAAGRLPLLLRHPVAAGLGYGLLLWLIIYGVVRPLRRPGLALPTYPAVFADQWFCHLILVGLPIAVVARRHLARPVYLPRL